MKVDKNIKCIQFQTRAIQTQMTSFKKVLPDKCFFCLVKDLNIFMPKTSRYVLQFKFTEENDFSLILMY